MHLTVLDGEIAVCRLPAEATVPEWAFAAHFWSITRTPHELSVVTDANQVPDGVRAERGWRILAVDGPLDFSLVGVLAAISMPLTDAAISLFALSTFDTDYILVKADRLSDAITTLRTAGHQVSSKDDGTGDRVMNPKEEHKL